MGNLNPRSMTLAEAIEILHPDTTLAALGEIEYFAGFNGQEAKIKACEAACIVACEAMQREVGRRAKPANEPLTLEELRGMSGEPVYLHMLNTGIKCWAVLMEISLGGGFVRFNSGQNALLTEDYGKTWLAYRCKPEEANPNEM